MKSSTKKKFSLPSKDGLQINFVFDRQLFGALKHPKAQSHVVSFTVVVKSAGWFLSFYKYFKFCRDAEGKNMVINGNRMLIFSKCWFAHGVEFISNWKNHVNSDG